jgi:predicted MFS family arabinose efflux permease
MATTARTLPERPGLVLAGTMFIAVTYGLVRFGYGLYLPEFSASLHISRATAGAIAAGSFAAYCLSAGIAFALIRRGRARAALWFSCALTAGGSAVVAASWSTEGFAAGMLVAGSGAGAASPALVSAVGSTVHPAREPRGQAIVNSGTGAGVVAGGILVALAGDAWRSAWLGFAVAVVVVAYWADQRATWSRQEELPSRTPRVGALLALRRALAAAVVAGAGSAAVWTFGRDVLIVDGNVSPGGAGILWALLGGAAAVGAVSGDLVLRLGLRLAWASSTAAAATGTGLVGLLPGVVPVAAFGLVLFGGAYVVLTGVLIAWGARLSPRGAGAATATLFIGLTVGQALGAVAVGLAAERWSLTGGFCVAAGVILASAGLAAPRTAPEPQADRRSDRAPER